MSSSLGDFASCPGMIACHAFSAETEVPCTVNARLLSDSGGPCECSKELAEDFACRFYDPVYDECVENFRRQLVTVSGRWALSKYYQR